MQADVILKEPPPLGAPGYSYIRSGGGAGVTAPPCTPLVILTLKETTIILNHGVHSVAHFYFDNVQKNRRDVIRKFYLSSFL